MQNTALRLGIIGLGNMGSAHADAIIANKLRHCALAAICDTDARRFKRYPNLQTFTNADALIASGSCEAVLIATPHYDHTRIGIQAIAAGLHTLVEKPISVHKADCERLLQAWAMRTRPDQVFAAMFNQRTDPKYRQLRELIVRGELGEIRRISWTITDWFRSDAYYASGGWRGTWKGEGGGVLTNQCPHQLDLLQWLFGMPVRVTAKLGIGARHNIEVEDEVTALLEYANGSTGVFTTSTGEAPGTNRLEVAAERGKVVIEDGSLRWTRNVTPVSEYSRTTHERFGRPDTWNVEIPVSGEGGQHVEVLQNFIDAARTGAPLIAPAEEGIHSVELGNAMLLSGMTGSTISLPIDGAAYEQHLQRLIEASTLNKAVPSGAMQGDFGQSFKR